MQQSEECIFTHRLAQTSDIPAIEALMEDSICGNMPEFLSPSEVDAARETMGVDKSLITDQTYFLIETPYKGTTILVGCGGWGKRKTLYGGDHAVWRDDAYSDPAVDAARIRAMYTHPNWTRKGIGSLLLDLGENAAREAGFSTIELGSTVPGEPLYAAKGYEEISRIQGVAENGAEHTVIKMAKKL